MFRNRRLQPQRLENRDLLAADFMISAAPAVLGDADLSGEFDSADLRAVFEAGKYETGEDATWGEGDWNHDGVFNSQDFVAALQAGNYQAALPAKGVQVNRASVMPFHPAGDVGGGVLTPGDVFAPTKAAHATFRTGEDWASYNIHTTGLPPGAYTVWLIMFGNPDACVDGCGEDDAYAALNAALAGSSSPTDVSVMWSNGGVVGDHGVGNFRAKINVGEAPGEVILPGSWMDGSIDLDATEFHAVIKYHGPASEDPEQLALQTSTILGGCESNANALTAEVLPGPLQTQCFDPQAVILRKPG